MYYCSTIERCYDNPSLLNFISNFTTRLLHPIIHIKTKLYLNYTNVQLYNIHHTSHTHQVQKQSVYHDIHCTGNDWYSQIRTKDGNY